MLTELCNDYPNYYCYRRLLIGSANAYGDYLLSKGVEPSLIEQQYAIAMHDLKRTLDEPELRAIQHGENGLAMQYYRTGTVALLGGDAANAKLLFERCALLREMAWLADFQPIVFSFKRLQHSVLPLIFCPRRNSLGQSHEP